MDCWNYFSAVNVQRDVKGNMKKKLIIGVVLTILSGLVLSETTLEQLNGQVQKLEKRLDGYERSSKQSQDLISDLKKQVLDLKSNGKNQQQKLIELNEKINLFEGKQTAFGNSLDQLSKDTDAKTETIDKTITSRSNWYGIALAVLLMMLSGCYWYLRQRNETSEKTLSAQMKTAIDTMRSTEEKIAKSDTALADSLFEILKKLKVQEIGAAVNNPAKLSEPDHNLPLKLADEIHRMRKRLGSLPEDTKGLTPLQKSLERLESELAEQGYEIIDHTGMAYSENLSVKARFLPSDDLGPDQKLISKVLVPQVNYKSVMIRSAEIEVSIGS
jgi:hypothetical protein